MFKTITAVASIPVGFAYNAYENVQLRKEMAARTKQRAKHDAEIAASIAKIGPYKPVTYVPVVWA